MENQGQGRPPHPTEDSEAGLGALVPQGLSTYPPPDPEFSLAQAPSMTRKALVWNGPEENWLGVLTPEFPSSENPALTCTKRGNSLQLPGKGV